MNGAHGGRVTVVNDADVEEVEDKEGGSDRLDP